MAIEFTFVTKSLSQVKDSTLVLFTNDVPRETAPQKSQPKKLSLTIKNVPKDLLAKLSDAVAESPYKGMVGDSLFFRSHTFLGFSNLMLVGLGDAKKVSHETIRRSVAQALKGLRAHQVKSATVSLETFPLSKSKEENLNALFEGFYLSDYTFEEFKTQHGEAVKQKLNLQIQSGLASTTKLAKDLHSDAVVTCDYVNFVRRIGDVPGNKMTPVILANEVKKASQGTGLKVTVWDEEKIKKEKMGCLLSVALGGGTEPRLIVMEYNGGGKSKKPICYVGKGLTFDAGGICIKPAPGMEEMKYDMMGGAAVIGTMLAIAKLKLKVNVIGIVPSSENMLGPMANKPGDIVAARNGKTVEINNTDAEGRLILSDALVYASEQNPEFIVDAATLTGAMVIALGDTHTGFFSNNNNLTQKIKKAASASGELVWEMPMHEEHLKDMKGSYADLQNVTQRKGAGSAHGAVFLSEFVDPKIPWAHFDIAGTAYHNGHRLPYTPARGASGVMVRTFLELAKQYSK